MRKYHTRRGRYIQVEIMGSIARVESIQAAVPS
jgi:hypothetical protein